MTHSAALSRPASRSADRQPVPPAPASLTALLDDAQAEHEKQIATLVSHTDELPVDDRNLSRRTQGEVLGNWQGIVGGTGNLRISEPQHDTATGLNRTHAGFRTKALSSIARLLQGPEGRGLIDDANEGGRDANQHITIAPERSELLLWSFA